MITDLNFRIFADPDQDCTYIFIEDLTIYPYETLERSDLGVALFYTSDLYTSIDGYDIYNNTDWSIPSTNKTLITIKAFVTDIWSGTATYNSSTEYKIVWHDGYFYYQSAAIPSGEPGAFGTTGWGLIAIGETNPLDGTFTTGLDIYDLFVYSIVTEDQDYTWSEINVETNCPAYSITKTACHKHTITDNSGATITVGEVKLYRYDGTLLDDELVFSGGEINIDLEDYTDGDDGVYYVEIWGQESTDTSDELKAQLLIYDLCDAETCYKNLFKYVICKCNDPCDEDCEDTYNIAQRRYDMNLIWGMYKQIEEYITVDKFQYMGMGSIDETRENYVAQVGRMEDKLKVITNRCGLCNSAESNDITC